MKITGKLRGRAKKKSRALPIMLSIFGILIILGGIGYVIASKIEMETYVVNLRLEATSAHPPSLTGVVNEGIVKETALLSIMPNIKFPSLSLLAGEHTRITGTIKFDCGSVYQEIRNFDLSTSIAGDEMIERFVYKNIPSDIVCSVVASALTCDTVQPYCTKNKVSQIVRIPK